MDYLALAIGAIFVSNILLGQFLGNCPFLGVSKKMSTATGMSMAVIFVITLASSVTWVIFHSVLVPFGLEYLRTLVFILVIAALVQLIELFLKKAQPTLYRALGIFLPLITTNCAVLGVAVKAIEDESIQTFMQCLVYSVASAVGFALALILFAGIRERFETVRIPTAIQGTGIGLVTAGFMSLAFSAFKGML